MTISWAGGNDYCIGSISGGDNRFYVEREGARWIAFDWKRTGRSKEESIAEGRTMREAQIEVERQFEAV